MTLSDGWAPFYPERVTSAFVEPSQLYLGYAVVAIVFGIFLVLPGVRGKERIFFLLRWSVTLFVGASILACVQGVSWHEASTEADMMYRVGSDQVVRFKVGLKIGLDTFNVTLSSDPENGKRMYFSEEFHFLDVDEELTSALIKGLPFPIINIVEQFSVSRQSSIWLWGRRYWISGHYGFMMLWTAFVAWVVANVLFHAVLRFGGLLLSFTGVLMLAANIAFSTINLHGRTLVIHMGYYDPDAVLIPKYGWCFYLCLFVGLFCFFAGICIVLFDQYQPKKLVVFFNFERENETVLLLEVDSQRNSIVVEEKYERYEGNNNPAFRDVKEPSSSRPSTSSSNDDAPKADVACVGETQSGITQRKVNRQTSQVSFQLNDLGVNESEKFTAPSKISETVESAQS